MSDETIYWHLPGLCLSGVINHVWFDTMKRFPEMFHENYKIGSVYGTFPGAIWNGGRNYATGSSSEKEVENIIKSYNVLGIPARFTWTNVLLDETHVDDAYCNMIMRAGNNGMNQVLVNSAALEDYVRRTYPDYKVLSSTTKRILSIDKLIEELEKDYYLVVLDYDLNHNESVIERLRPYADRIEILVNETCRPNCPNRVAHYRDISKCQLEHNGKWFACTDTNPDARTFSGCMKRPQFMSTNDIVEYSKMGYRNFKIVGRGLSPEFYLDSLTYYFVKPENREFIRKYMDGILSKMGNGAPSRPVPGKGKAKNNKPMGGYRKK